MIEQFLSRVAGRGVLLALLVLGQLHGQGPLVPPAPLAPPPPPVSKTEISVALAAARRAHDLGLLSVAAGLYRQVLDIPGADRSAVTLALVTVLLDAGLAAEAEKALGTVPEPRGPAWNLRHGLVALQLGKRDIAQAAWDTTNLDQLTPPDRAWHIFLQGALYDTLPNRDSSAISKANEFYNDARAAATTELAKARFQLAAERVRLQLAPPTAQDLEQSRKLYEQWQGREPGYEPARQYAVKLALLDRKSDAVQFLQQEVLLGLPERERGWRDEFNFLIGMFGDRSRTGVGRNALMQLLATGTKAERQRQALQLLADSSEKEPERGHFRAELTRLLAMTPAHPLKETLLYFRAQLALVEKDFATAEDHANQLLREFPGSPLRAHVFGLLTQSAWEQQRFRQAAPNARNAREALPDDAASGGNHARARADLGVLEAEAWFLAGDFRNAADAYAAVLRERSPELGRKRLSELMFMRVLAEIRAGSQQAADVLDEVAQDPAFLVVDRWQAEWSLARDFQLQGKTAEAYTRIGRLIGSVAVERAPPPGVLSPELRTRMAWLHAQLSLDADRPEETLPLVDDLLNALGGVENPLRTEIASTAVLLKAKAEFALERETAALETLSRLRAEHPGTDAAMHSYLIESHHYAAQEKINEAQLRLTRLIGNEAYEDSAYVPFALFELARLSEQLGQEKDLQEANKRIEQLVDMPAAAGNAELIFAARLKQGDLLRQLSQFPQAQRAYEYLVNNYAQRPDVVLAQLALADCHNAQSSAEPTHADHAQLLYEQLRDRVDAPADVRVEAGYKLGYLISRRPGQKAKAVEVWMRDVITPFLLQNNQPFRMDDKRPYWLARTLVDMGKLLEEEGRLEEARNAYELVVTAGLGEAERLAQEGLKRLGVSEAKL